MKPFLLNCVSTCCEGLILSQQCQRVKLNGTGQHRLLFGQSVPSGHTCILCNMKLWMPITAQFNISVLQCILH